MAFGLGTKHKKTPKTSAKKSKSKTDDSGAEELLKQMEDKKDAGNCPFC